MASEDAKAALDDVGDGTRYGATLGWDEELEAMTFCDEPSEELMMLRLVQTAHMRPRVNESRRPAKHPSPRVWRGKDQEVAACRYMDQPITSSSRFRTGARRSLVLEKVHNAKLAREIATLAPDPRHPRYATHFSLETKAKKGLVAAHPRNSSFGTICAPLVWICETAEWLASFQLASIHGNSGDGSAPGGPPSTWHGNGHHFTRKVAKTRWGWALMRVGTSRAIRLVLPVRSQGASRGARKYG